MTGTILTDTFYISGLTCADCAEKLAAKIRATVGVEDAELNFMAAKMIVHHHLSTEAIVRLLQQAGYEAVAEGAAPVTGKSSFMHTHHRLLSTLLSGALLLTAWILSLIGVAHVVILPLYLATILIGGLWTIRRGLASLRLATFDMNALMTIAVVGACFIGQWPEAASVAVLFSISNMLEAYSLDKTRHSLRGMLDLAPRVARIRSRDGGIACVPVEQLQPDDIVLVKPGEIIATDGVVIAGASAVNQAAITGESLPIEKGEGDTVYAGTLNALGALDIRVTRLAADTTLAHIIQMVEDAQARRAPSQAFIDRFSRIYTPAVLALAAVLAVGPPLLWHGVWHAWIYRALALIVVACPCALVISTPVAIVSAIGNAARHGVLIKGGAFLEQLGSISVMAFDKTGTLTLGQPELTDILPTTAGIDSNALLALAAAVETRASHALADAIVRQAQARQVQIPPVTEASSLPGRGAQGNVAGHTIYVGNRRYFRENGFDLTEVESRIAQLESAGKTAMLVGRDGMVLGLLAAADTVRMQSKPMIRELQHAGISHIALLTGDHRETAERIAFEVGVDDVRAELLPEDKAKAIQALREQHGAVGMVGDGINDAPALATATVGIAMGVAGSDAALETADIALMADDLSKIPFTVRLSRRTLGIIRQNIIIALTIKAIAVALVFPGLLTLWLAVLADMGASILVTLNGLRLVQHEQVATPVATQCNCTEGHCEAECCAALSE